MLNVYVRGLRDLQGRFAAMTDHGLRTIQLEEAQRVAMVLEDIYRRHAPRSRGTGGGEGGKHFYEGITARAEASGFGFVIRLETDKPDLRHWLATGTGIYGPRGERIFPKHARALGPIRNWVGGAGSGPFWFRSIAGMKAQPWELPARAEANPAMIAMGNRIGNRVVSRLGAGL